MRALPIEAATPRGHETDKMLADSGSPTNRRPAIVAAFDGNHNLDVILDYS